MVVLVMRTGGASMDEIAESTGLARNTVMRIVHHAPEAEAFRVATNKAGVMGLQRLVPHALSAIELHIKSGKDPNISMGLLRGLQLLTPKAELVEGVKEEQMDEAEIDRRLLALLAQGAKKKE